MAADLQAAREEKSKIVYFYVYPSVHVITEKIL